MTDNALMPDFVATLEQRLRAAAPSEAVQRTARRGVARPRLALPAAASLALAAIAVTLIATDEHTTPAAYGRPLILSTPPVDASKQLQGGIAMRLALGPDAELTSARPIPAFGGTAYLVKGDRGWCLTAPDPDAPDPERERGVTCASNAALLKYGISLRIGGHFMAAIPQGVKNPVLARPDGSVRDLQPSGQGVVVADGLAAGTVIRVFSADGAARATTVRNVRNG
jgi:hypothetical protein